jgi:hypothetical protein
MDNLKHRIDALCGKAIAASGGSEELTSAMYELRKGLADRANDLRRQVGDLRQEGIPHSLRESTNLANAHGDRPVRFRQRILTTGPYPCIFHEVKLQRVV